MMDTAAPASLQPSPTPGLPRVWRRTLLVIVALAVLHVIVLRMMGRIAWCACGSPTPLGQGGEHNSQHLLDWYTPSHLLHGVIFFWLLRIGAMARWTLSTRLIVAAVVEIVWEIIENTPMVINRYRAATTADSYYGDSIANSTSDVIACLLGFELARRIGRMGSIAVFFFFELLTLVLIRDNLTLNVVMLLWPIDAVKRWQMHS